MRIEHFNKSYILVCSKVHFYKKPSIDYIYKCSHITSSNHIKVKFDFSAPLLSY